MAADTTGRLAAFRDFVADARFATNVSADKVIAYNRAGQVLDTRRFYIQQAGGDVAAGLATFAARQGAFLARREAFEDLWDGGREFVYGAVNAGGLGAEGDYGPFCLVVDGGPPEPVAFPGDSLARYTDTAGGVDARRAEVEATAWTERADLAVTERRHDIGGAAADWATTLCAPDRYLEAVRRGPSPVAAVTEVRLGADHRARLGALRARVLSGETLTPVERNEAAAYDVINRWRRAYGTTIGEVG